MAPTHIKQKVALLTGAATGIGNGVAANLASKGWKIVILDYNTAIGQSAAFKLDGDFFQTDVRSWAEQYRAFEETMSKYGRIDFVHANAGIAESLDYFDEGVSFTAESPPNMDVLSINLTGATYTAMLAISAFRKNPKTVTDALLVLTASAAGIYPTNFQPIYAASKHGVVGLARSLGLKHANEGIRVCALAPGIVPTAILPAETVEATDKSMITPISHIVKAVDTLLEGKLNGAVCEASVDRFYYREAPEFADEAMEKLFGEVALRMAVDFEKARKDVV